MNDFSNFSTLVMCDRSSVPKIATAAFSAIPLIVCAAFFEITYQNLFFSLLFAAGLGLLYAAQKAIVRLASGHDSEKRSAWNAYLVAAAAVLLYIAVEVLMTDQSVADVFNLLTQAVWPLLGAAVYLLVATVRAQFFASSADDEVL